MGTINKFMKVQLKTAKKRVRKSNVTEVQSRPRQRQDGKLSATSEKKYEPETLIGKTMVRSRWRI